MTGNKTIVFNISNITHTGDFEMQLSLPELKTGEINAGLIMKPDGTPDYWLILAPEQSEPAAWQAQMDWAAGLAENGEYSLPDLRELSLLRANAREHFKNDWYWSNTQHASYSAYAWYQHFSTGNQVNWLKGLQLRARAVRRSVI